MLLKQSVLIKCNSSCVNLLFRSVGTFVLYTTYIVQLYGPLNFLGTWFRMIQQSFIDMENMLDLFMECPEVQDKNDCTPLVISGGEIEFEQVCFHYTPEKPILSNVSFKVSFNYYCNI